MSIIEEEEEIVKLKCNRCTGRTLVEEDFPLKKIGVGRTKSCKFCVEYQVKYGKEKYANEKEEVLEKFKQLRIDSEGKWGEVFTCVCGSSLKYINKSKHFHTVKHKEYIKNNPVQVETI
jgi:hypothetical protein